MNIGRKIALLALLTAILVLLVTVSGIAAENTEEVDFIVTETPTLLAATGSNTPGGQDMPASSTNTDEPDNPDPTPVVNPDDPIYEDDYPFEVTTGGTVSTDCLRASLSAYVSAPEVSGSCSYGILYGTADSELYLQKEYDNTYVHVQGDFTVTLDGLTPNTRYYYAAYIEKPSGARLMGEVKNFLTRSDSSMQVFYADDSPVTADKSRTLKFTPAANAVYRFELSAPTYITIYSTDLSKIYEKSFYSLFVEEMVFPQTFTVSLKKDTTYYVDISLDAGDDSCEISARQCGWIGYNETEYRYIDASSGKMVTGWKYIDDDWYYFADDGRMYHDELLEYNNSLYGFRSNGAMAMGLFTYMDTAYFFDTNGKAMTGWRTNNGYWYYFDASTYKALTGRQTINNTEYYFGTDGKMFTKWQKINDNWYYFASSGNMTTGWFKLSSKWYYFGSDGIMAEGFKTIGDVTYYLTPEDGYMVTGWNKIDGNWYYFASSGKMTTGWCKLSSKWYYFAADGKMLTGRQDLGGTTYFFNSSGAMTTGWAKDTDGTWYYARSSGALYKNGTYTIGGSSYSFDANGAWLG